MQVLRFLLCLVVCGVAGVRASEFLPVEQHVQEAVKAPTVTVVHFWAPWCPNCLTELRSDGWPAFVEENPDVKVIFVTIWAGDKGDGRALLEKSGLLQQPNFELHLHPNTARSRAEKMTHFLGQPVTWVPTTWVYRGGTLRYALNYGEVRFSILQQLVRDAASKW